MTAPTPTAATPEELARITDMRASLDRAYAVASPTGAANHLAAWANNHGKALLDLAEAQRTEIERLTEALDDLKDKLAHIDWVRSERRDPPTPEIEEGIKRAADVLFFTAVNRDNPAAADDIWCLAMDVLHLAPTHDARWKELEAEMERTTAAEAALSASQERERRMREVLEPLLFPLRGRCGGPLVRLVAHYEDGHTETRGHEDQERAWKAFRAALQQETADGR